MSRKHVTDEMVCMAYLLAFDDNNKWPSDFLKESTGECEKVCFKAMERAYDKGYIECGVSLRSGWLTAKGVRLLKSFDKDLNLGWYEDRYSFDIGKR